MMTEMVDDDKKRKIEEEAMYEKKKKAEMEGQDLGLKIINSDMKNNLKYSSSRITCNYSTITFRHYTWRDLM